MTRKYDVGKASGRDAGVAAASEALGAGRLVAMPTETVYGLAADAANGRAVAAIYELKGRPRFNPLIAHVASQAMAEGLASFDARARLLAERFWPGPLTLVLPKRPGAPIADLALAGLETVAIRMPAHPVALKLIATFGRPVVAPSANRSGRVSATTAAHVMDEFPSGIEIVLDAGPTEIGVESTIVGLAGPAPVLLRPGGLPREAIEAVVGTLGVPVAGSIEAPGMLESHYAPVAQLRLNAATSEPGEALLAFGPVPPGAGLVFNLSPTGDLKEAAANLFAGLRWLDARAARIAAMPIPDAGLGEAINDRLLRAAAPRK